ncbi:MAG: hypothetical protein O3C65_04025 [Proteobacteria bacterium]|nr:hypothetical protein [Pseudomonadota bacterium]MDA1057833.1 hypothetical protein [Pseudomonadota bacterium]
MTMFRRALLITGLIGGIGMATLPAHAQNACFTRDQAIENLKEKYGEEVTARGLSNDGKVMIELLTSTTGSWTLLMTHADGKTCMVSTGESWTAITAVKAAGPAV